MLCPYSVRMAFLLSACVVGRRAILIGNARLEKLKSLASAKISGGKKQESRCAGRYFFL